MENSELHPDVGHVHLRVTDLERAVAFYRDALGFAVTAYGAEFGMPGRAFLAAGAYHHIGSKQANHRRRMNSERNK